MGVNLETGNTGIDPCASHGDPPTRLCSSHGHPPPGRPKIVLRPSKIIHFWFHEGIRHESDFVSVSASIWVPFWRAWERQKLGFRIGGLHFLQSSGDARWDAVSVALSGGLGQDSALFWASCLCIWSLQPTWTPPTSPAAGMETPSPGVQKSSSGLQKSYMLHFTRVSGINPTL